MLLSFLPVHLRSTLLSSVAAALVATCTVAAPSHAAFPHPQLGDNGMVTTAHPLATKAAVSILEKGGNAVDAAIAAALAISVVEPFSAGIGGGGFAIIHDEKTGEIKALDFREKAPAKATRDMYVDPKTKEVTENAVNGYLSVAIPGTVAGLWEMHQKGGKLSWKTLVEPAIKLAADGFVVTERFVEAYQERADVLERYESTRDVFMVRPRPKAKLRPLQRGDRLVQTDLAKTLRAIAKNPQNFYTGTIAKQMADDVQQHGGILSVDDLKNYRPTWRAPVCGPYRSYEICSMPPPSSGGIHLLQMLYMLNTTDFTATGYHSPNNLHSVIETMRLAYADRAAYLGDPAFVDVPTKGLLTPAYLDERRKTIDPQKAHPNVPAGDEKLLKKLSKESQDTSHLTVVDRDHNAVSMTFTVNYGFGSGVIASGTGVLLNDEMDDFAAAPGVPNSYGLVGGEANSIAAGKIPLSSMTPTVARQDKHFRFALGSPGGSTIITTVLQGVINIVDFGMDAQAAVAAPRLHQQWLPVQVRVEPFGFDQATLDALRARGHELKSDETWGNASAIRLRSDGVLEGGVDPRGEGAALGL